MSIWCLQLCLPSSWFLNFPLDWVKLLKSAWKQTRFRKSPHTHPAKIQQHQLGCLQTQRPHTGWQGTCANLRLPEESHGQKTPPEIELLRSGYDLGNLFPGKKSDWTDTAQKWMGCSQPGSFISSYAGEPMSESSRGGNQTQMMESASLKSTS